MKLEPMSAKFAAYLSDESHIKGECEDIAFPKTQDEVKEVVKLSFDDGKKITVQGARTGLVGACVPTEGRIINLTLLNEVSDVSENECGAFICAQSGATLEDISKKAQSRGYFFPPNATEETASIGGMFSTNAEGPNSVFYNSVSNYVKKMDFTFPNGESYTINRGDYKVHDNKLSLPNGKVLDFGKIPNNLPFVFYKDEMDLIDFLAGKEGRFGITSSFTLSLLKNPADIWGIVFFFDDNENAVNFIEKVRTYKSDCVNITTGEYYSEEALNLIKNHLENPLLSKLPELPQNAKSAFYVEIESEAEEQSEEALMDLLDMFAESGGNEDDTWAQSGKSAVKSFRDMRHAVVSILNEDTEIHSQVNGTRWETDIKASENKFKEYLTLYNDVLSKCGLKGAIYGSALKNHLHVAFLAKGDEQELCDEAILKISRKAVADSAKIGTKYGIGRVKRELISNLLSDEVKKIIANIIKSVDEKRILNP